MVQNINCVLPPLRVTCYQRQVQTGSVTFPEPGEEIPLLLAFCVYPTNVHKNAKYQLPRLNYLDISKAVFHLPLAAQTLFKVTIFYYEQEEH